MGRNTIEGERTAAIQAQPRRRRKVWRPTFIAAGITTAFYGPAKLIYDTFHSATYEASPRSYYTAIGLTILGETLVAGAAFFPKIKEIFVASRNRRAKVVYTSGENVTPQQDVVLENI